MLNSTFLINDSVTNNGKTDYIIHNKTSDGVTFFEIRNTSTHQFILPHVINSKREKSSKTSPKNVKDRKKNLY